MTEEPQFRKVTSNCDCCKAESIDVNIVVLDNGDAKLLCDDCLAFISDFVDVYVGKWSELLK